MTTAVEIMDTENWAKEPVLVYGQILGKVMATTNVAIGVFMPQELLVLGSKLLISR